VIPLGKAIGGGLVFALGAAISIVSGFLRVIKPFISFLNDNRSAVLMLVSALGALKVALEIKAAIQTVDTAIATLRMGFVAQTVATVGLRGGLQALIASIRGFMVAIGPVGWAIGAVSIVAGVLAGKWIEGATAADKQSEAQRRLHDSSIR